MGNLWATEHTDKISFGLIEVNEELEFIQYLLLFLYRFVQLLMNITHSNLEVCFYEGRLADRHAIQAQSYIYSGCGRITH